mgnify:FL=1
MVVSMWGICDGADIIFTQTDDSAEHWECIVPADLNDGTYVVEIWAQAQTGYIIYTTAVLYLCDGTMLSLEFDADDLFVQISTDDYLIEMWKG